MSRFDVYRGGALRLDGYVMAVDRPNPLDACASMSDDKLLKSVALTQSDPAVAERACREFHGRYAQSLYAACRRLCGRFGLPSPTADDLVSTAFAKAFERASTFRPSPDLPSVAQGKRTLAWLYRIAERILLDWHRNPQRPGPLNQTGVEPHVEDYGGEDFAFLMADHFDAKGSSHLLRLLAHAFETSLTEREQRVMLYTLIYRGLSASGAYMQRGKLREVAEAMGTTGPNIRKIRERAMAKLARIVKAGSCQGGGKS